MLVAQQHVVKTTCSKLTCTVEEAEFMCCCVTKASRFYLQAESPTDDAADGSTQNIKHECEEKKGLIYNYESSHSLFQALGFSARLLSNCGARW